MFLLCKSHQILKNMAAIIPIDLREKSSPPLHKIPTCDNDKNDNV